MARGLVAMLFVVMVVIITFLMFQVNDNANRYKATLVNQQEKVSQTARYLLQSATSNHPFFAIENSLRAKIMIDEIVQDNGGILAAERNLKLPKGRLRDLRDRIYLHHGETETFIMDNVIAQYSQFDVPENDLAALNDKMKRHHSKSASKTSSSGGKRRKKR